MSPQRKSRSSVRRSFRVVRRATRKMLPLQPLRRSLRIALKVAAESKLLLEQPKSPSTAPAIAHKLQSSKDLLELSLILETATEIPPLDVVTPRSCEFATQHVDIHRAKSKSYHDLAGSVEVIDSGRLHNCRSHLNCFEQWSSCGETVPSTLVPCTDNSCVSAEGPVSSPCLSTRCLSHYDRLKSSHSLNTVYLLDLVDEESAATKPPRLLKCFDVVSFMSEIPAILLTLGLEDLNTAVSYPVVNNFTMPKTNRGASSCHSSADLRITRYEHHEVMLTVDGTSCSQRARDLQSAYPCSKAAAEDESNWSWFDASLLFAVSGLSDELKAKKYTDSKLTMMRSEEFGGGGDLRQSLSGRRDVTSLPCNMDDALGQLNQPVERPALVL